MPDFDFLKDLDPQPEPKPAPEGKAPDSPESESPNNAALEFDFLSELTPEKPAGEDLAADALGELSIESQPSVEATSAPAPAAADDPLADALSELETEAAPAATFEPLADMTADTTGAVSDDPQFDIDDSPAGPAEGWVAESTASGVQILGAD